MTGWRENAAFQFTVHNNFGTMENEYNQSDDYSYREEVNLMNALLEDPLKDKEISLHEDLMPDLGEDSQEESEEQQDQVTPLNRNLLEKEEFNCRIPEKLFIQGLEESPLLLQPANRKPQPPSPVNSRRDTNFDKIAYQFQSRGHKVERYRMKKSHRVWGRKVSYGCRKVVADSRERINGRFAKKSPCLAPSDFAHKYSLATGELQLLKQSGEFKGLEEFFQ